MPISKAKASRLRRHAPLRFSADCSTYIFDRRSPTRTQSGMESEEFQYFDCYKSFAEAESCPHEIVALLGKGGLCEVYRARDEGH